MEDVFVGRLMSTSVHTVTPHESVQEAAQKMIDHEIGSVVVVDADGDVDGILTSTDFVRIVAEGHPSAETTVSAHMTTDVVTTDANADVRDVADTMIERGFHHVPVVDDTEGVIGMITTTDLTAYLSRVRKPSPA